MRKLSGIFSKKAHIFIVLILILGFILRTNNLTVWPRLGATFDEYAWTWLGMNLIQTGVPVSWSPHTQYQNAKYITYQKTGFRLVTPYLEHPPVFGLIVGLFALLNGAKDMYHVTIQTIRPLAVITGLLSIIVLYVFTLEVYDKKTALLSSLLYATVPTIVVGSRIVENENFFIPFWLLALFFVSKYLKTNKLRYRNTAAVICGFLSLAKVPWLAAAFSIIIIFMFLKRYYDIFLFLLIVIPMFLLFFVYGFYYNSGLFLNLWGLQLNRYDITFSSIYALFREPYLVDRFYPDGWIYFGWFAFILLTIKNIKKNFFIILPSLSYFLVFVAVIPNEPSHGWYRYPFYPFLIISISLFLKEYFPRNHILSFFFLVFVGTTLFDHTWDAVFGFSYIMFRLILFGWGLVLIPPFIPFKSFFRWSRYLNFFWFAVFIVLNIWSVMLYNEQ